jgi:hypothetical protein
MTVPACARKVHSDLRWPIGNPSLHALSSGRIILSDYKTSRPRCSEKQLVKPLSWTRDQSPQYCTFKLFHKSFLVADANPQPPIPNDVKERKDFCFVSAT